MIGGVLSPLFKALGSLVLWAAAAAEARPAGHTASEPTIWIPAAAVLFSLGLVVLAARWGRLYTQTLRDTLEQGSVELPGGGSEDAVATLIDGPRLAILLEAIDRGSQRSRELALELLRPHRSALVLAAMAQRLGSPSESIRITALRWLAVEPQPSLLPLLQIRWDNPSASVAERIALLEAAGRSAPALLGADPGRWLPPATPTAPSTSRLRSRRRAVGDIRGLATALLARQGGSCAPP